MSTLSSITEGARPAAPYTRGIGGTETITQLARGAVCIRGASDTVSDGVAAEAGLSATEVVSLNAGQARRPAGACGTSGRTLQT